MSKAMTVFDPCGSITLNIVRLVVPSMVPLGAISSHDISISFTGKAFALLIVNEATNTLSNPSLCQVHFEMVTEGVLFRFCIC